MRIALIMMITSVACGDSGLVRLSEVTPPWRVTIMTDPTPLREGPIDISLLLQTHKGGTAVLDAHVDLELEGPDGLRLTTTASHSQAENQLLYAAKFSLPAAGEWNVLTRLEHDDTCREVRWTLTAAGPTPPLAAAWPWLLPAPLGIALFACNRALRRSRTP